jgi:hypothetical protein
LVHSRCGRFLPWREANSLGVILEDKFDEELFARQKKRTEQTMKIVITLLAAVFAFVLFYLVKNG